MLFRRLLRRAASVLFVAGLLGVTCDCHAPPPKQATNTAPNVIVHDNKLIITVHIDEKFSGLERALILKGLHEWERGTDGIIAFKIKADWNSDDVVIPGSVPDPLTGLVQCTHDVYIARVLSSDDSVLEIEDVIEQQEGEHTTIAGYAHMKCRSKVILMVVDRIEDSKQYVALTLHEMGHIIGMQHVSGNDKFMKKMIGKAVMYPSLGGDPDCLTEWDLEQFCKIWKCNAKELKSCKP